MVEGMFAQWQKWSCAPGASIITLDQLQKTQEIHMLWKSLWSSWAILSTYIISTPPLSDLHRLACLSWLTLLQDFWKQSLDSTRNLGFGIQFPSSDNDQLCDPGKVSFSEFYVLHPANDENVSLAHSRHLIFSLLLDYLPPAQTSYHWQTPSWNITY